MSSSDNTRRWPRHQVDLPVRIVALNGILTTPAQARGSEISRAGMALHTAIALEPGDWMQLQLPTSTPSRVTAVVRNRKGNRLGLEFLTQLPPDDKAQERAAVVSDPTLCGTPALRQSARPSCNPQTLFAGLRKKRRELTQVQKEIEALRLAIVLLVE